MSSADQHAAKATAAPRVAFVTGRLAEPALRRVVSELTTRGKVDPVIIVLNIQVAALMTPAWVERKLELPNDSGRPIERVILPGHCRGDLTRIAAKLGVPVERGPIDLHDLPQRFGDKSRATREGYGAHRIQIIAEINDAARWPMEHCLALAESYRRDGADVIDIGCEPQASERGPWKGVAELTRELRARGFRVSVDTFHPREIELAAEAGAELVLSVNSSNLDAACASRGWGMEVVAIPDVPEGLVNLDQTLGRLSAAGVRFRIDPIIEPIGFGFAKSLGRYLDVRERYPEAAMMMGVGNLTELTEVDSAGVNATLIGFCEEMRVESVLTTQVINWARSSVREIDIARRMMHHAVRTNSTPKRIDPRLVMLRDDRLRGMSEAEMNDLAGKLTDRNIRLFADHATGLLHAMNKDFHITADDPFVLFDRVLAQASRDTARAIDASHAFYLGYELSKAITALTLGKNYTQDIALDWGFATRDETSHQERKNREGQTPP